MTNEEKSLEEKVEQLKKCIFGVDDQIETYKSLVKGAIDNNCFHSANMWIKKLIEIQEFLNEWMTINPISPDEEK